MKKRDKKQWMWLKANALRKEQRSQNNRYELIVYEILKQIGVRFVWQKIFHTDKRYCVVDFYIPKLKLVIEVDGKHHKKGKDAERTEWLYKRGVRKVYRIKNESVINEPQVVKNKIATVISYL